MPRIDPLQLLKCLSVLLSPEGGIMSREEVPRLVNLMTKFSKKLVSKCVYLLILKSTEGTLVDMFMASGGWLLIHTWLQEAMAGSNWNLVQEVLELLLVTPVDSSRLRLNNIPKLVKTLSKREDLGDVKEMATMLVNNWLAIVKNSTLIIQDSEKATETPVKVAEEIKEVKTETNVEPPKIANEIETVELPEAPVVEEEPTKMEVEDEDAISTGMFYKITVRDGKQVITKLSNSDDTDEKLTEETEVTGENVQEKRENDIKENKTKKEESKSKTSSSSSKKSSSSSSNKKSSSSGSSSSSKDKDKKHSSRSSSSKSSSSSSSRDKDKEKSRKDKDKENDKDKQRNNGSLKNSSSSSSSKSSSSSSSSKDKDKKDSKEPKEKQAEKDKDTLAKLKPATLDKIGRIPKKISSAPDDKDIKKKPSISIEPKKKAEDRPKTVKIFNSKMRSTGLEEEAKPPPPRNAVKKPPPVIPPVLPLPPKRPSPTRDLLATPPEKKMKIDIPERAGAIKLIPPKPKPAVLLESDIFMDALTAATSKKEPKKRKRRLSMSKESPENSPTVQPAGATSPIGLKNFSPANFYQDTLETTNETEESKEEKTEEKTEENTEEEKVVEEEEKTVSEEISEVSEPPVTRTNSDGLKGVLVYLKRKGPKRSLRWREEKDLVDIRYFELDETERVNVSRTNFTDMAKLEMTNEREALMGRKLMNEDLMEPTTLWRIPYLVDQPDLPVQPGSKSLEKDIQYAREKNILQALYFNKSLIPDSPAEPILETHPMVDPVIIPLEDAESQNYDLRNTPWPEPKGLAPVEHPPVNMPPMFQNIPGPFPTFPQMGPQGFPGMPGPGFCPPNMMPNGPPNMMPNNNLNMMGNPNMNMGAPMDMMNQGPMNPNMYGPVGPPMDNFNPMINDNQNFPMPYNQPNMYGPPNNNNNNFNNMDRGGGHRGRGGYRRGHNNSNNWGRNGPRGGNNNWKYNREDHRGGTGRICKNIKNHGYCRNIENCPFVHPN